MTSSTWTAVRDHPLSQDVHRLEGRAVTLGSFSSPGLNKICSTLMTWDNHRPPRDSSSVLCRLPDWVSCRGSSEGHDLKWNPSSLFGTPSFFIWSFWLPRLSSSFSIPGELIPTRLCGLKNTQSPPRMVRQDRAQGGLAHPTGRRRGCCW